MHAHQISENPSCLLLVHASAQLHTVLLLQSLFSGGATNMHVFVTAVSYVLEPVHS